jgi:YD repeat-containing protein
LKKINGAVTLRGVVLLAAAMTVANANAQNDTPTPYEEYAKKTQAANVISPLTDASFGDQVKLYDGSVKFSVTDIDVPGNNEIPVRLGRSFDVVDRRQEYFLKGFGDWQIDVPSIYGEFLADKGWVLKGSSPYARCSLPGKPDTAPTINGNTYQAAAELVWSGYHLKSYEGDSELLVDNQAKTPAITAPGSHPWITRELWRISCLASTANGYPGEAFLAVSPEGHRYRFDYAVSVPIKSYRMSNSLGTFHAPRVRVHMLVTRIDDRFGNWVTFSYQDDKLSQISASDGRSIVLSYSGDLIQSATSAGRTWSYAYGTTNAYPSLQGGPTLNQVTLPDSSTWAYTIQSGSLMPKREPTEPGALGPGQGGGEPWVPTITIGDYVETAPGNFTAQCRSEPDRRDGEFKYSVKHPSGALATYDLRFDRMYRGHTPKHFCDVPQGQDVPTPYFPHYSDRYRLWNKTISGPGLQTQTWQYLGGAGSVTYYTTGSATTPCPTCVQSKTVTVLNPDGTRDLSEFGQLFGLNEGRLLSSSRLDSAGVVVSSTTYGHVSDSEAPTMAFPSQWGTSLMWFANPLINLARPVHTTTISQDGVAFKSFVPKTCGGNYCFDAFGRATRETKQGPSLSRTDSTSYFDNTTSWVLGQVASITNQDTGLLVEESSFNMTSSLPTVRKAFGRTIYSSSYNSDGTLASVTDGNGNQTLLSNWKRGLPGSIKYPATPESPSGAMRSAVISDSGLIASVTDENGFQTSYGYDDMGRLNRISYPSGDAVNYNDWTGDFRPLVSADSRPAGVADGQWVRIERQGSFRRYTYMDALWRPVRSHEYDNLSSATTLRGTSMSYDASGRLAFKSYPAASTSPPAQGVWTTYDALGRTKSVSEDSESGVLTVLTEYLSGFKTRTTNAKNQQSTTSYQVLDHPSYEYPVLIQHPENANTEITRDIFGKPLSITRQSADGTLSLTRRYVYQADQMLCKTIEPETGVTVIGYDLAANVTKSAAGLSGLADITQCNSVQAWAGPRVVERTYDARNRLKTLTFADGHGNQQWAYTPDGLPAQVVTYNDPASGSAVTNSYVYNRRRLLEGESVTQSVTDQGPVTRSLGYGYDANGQLARHVYSTGLIVAYEPNALGQATRAGTYATGASYYPNGAVKQFTYGNGIVHTMSQNARQLPQRVLSSGGVYDLSYFYDPNGNVSVIADETPGRSDGTYSRWLHYDGLDRLTDAGSCMFGGDCWHRFTYDALDNIKSWKLAGGKDYATYVYDSRNQLGSIKNSGGATIVAFGYDEQGNVDNKNGQLYDFDDGNRLRSTVNKEDYRYDGHGRRVMSSSVQGQILSFYDQAGVLRREEDARQGKHADHIYLAGSLVARVSTVVSPGTPLLTVPAYSTAGNYTVQWTTVTAASHYEVHQQANDGAWQAAYSGSSLSLSRSGMTGGTYAYRARACNPSACGSWSASASVTVELPPAAAPSLSVPATALNGNYSVSWTSVSGATSYQLQQNSNGGTWSDGYSGAVRSQPYTSVPAATYGYRVRACNPAGCSGWSASASVVVIYPPAGTPAVSATPTLSNTGSYAVSWTGVPGATNYQLEESALGGGWSVLLNQPVSTWSASGKVAGSYLYRVTGCNSAGCGATSSAVTVQVVLPPTQVPAISVPGSLMVDNYTVSWTAAGAATSYQLEERVNGGGWALVHDAALASKAFAGKANATYGYRVRGCNVGGCGPWSGEAVTVVNVPPAIPAVPTGLGVIRDFNDAGSPPSWSADVNWSASYGATSYQVQQKIGTAAPTIPYTGTGTWVRIPNVGRTTVLTYWVRACSANGCSAWSAGVSP